MYIRCHLINIFGFYPAAFGRLDRTFNRTNETILVLIVGFSSDASTAEAVNVSVFSPGSMDDGEVEFFNECQPAG